jgi:hypothetical protein
MDIRLRLNDYMKKMRNELCSSAQKEMESTSNQEIQGNLYMQKTRVFIINCLRMALALRASQNLRRKKAVSFGGIYET